ncbi:MAG: response regulator [Bdellovibrionota bacterium]|nr:response regulator [Bdellovibrionota bacterium]
MKLRILIADDAPFIHEVLKAHLRVYPDASVHSVYDGLELLEKYDSIDPHIVFVDLAMPKKNGLQATRAILQRHPHAKLVAISSMASDDMVADAIASGCVDFLDKSFKVEEFRETVDSLVAGFVKERNVVNG